MVNSHAIQSIKKSHSFIFLDPTMSKHQVFISNTGNSYSFVDSSCLILTIHLFRFNTNDNDYQLSCFESKTLIDFGTFHIIQFEPKWNNKQRSFSFLSLHFSRIGSKYLITVLYRHAIAKWKIMRFDTLDWFFIHFYW